MMRRITAKLINEISRDKLSVTYIRFRSIDMRVLHIHIHIDVSVYLC